MGISNRVQDIEQISKGIRLTWVLSALAISACIAVDFWGAGGVWCCGVGGGIL